MVPVLDGLRTDFAGKLDVEFIDITRDHEAGEAWRVEIMPTQVYLSADGHELARHQGFASRDDILAQWQQLGLSFK
jgi:thioredoxin 1